MLIADDGKRLAPPPRRVAILGMGPTLKTFIDMTLMNPGPGGVVDEVWGLNNVVSAVRCDVGFIMDDFVEMLERPYMGNKAAGIPGATFWDPSNPKLMEWCRSEQCNIPLLTSRAYRPRYPTSCTFPLQEAMVAMFGSNIGFHLSNSTSYAILYARLIGVQEIHLYGVDFGYPSDDPYDRRRILEAGRANVESLLMVGFMQGAFTFHMSADTSLFDTRMGRPFYGYADGRKAIRPEMQTHINLGGHVENDTRKVPDDNAARSPESRGIPTAELGGAAVAGGVSGEQGIVAG